MLRHTRNKTLGCSLSFAKAQAMYGKLIKGKCCVLANGEQLSMV